MDKSIAVFDRDGTYLSHCSRSRAYKIVHENKAIFIGLDMIKLNVSKRKETVEKKQIIREANRRCYICNDVLYRHCDTTVDHLIPFSRDKKFANFKFNKRCCCRRCNQDKDNMTLVEYIEHIRQNREKYTYLSDRRIDYLERYAKQHEKDYYAITRGIQAEGGEDK